MRKIPVRQITGQTFCHESEDLDKVREAFYPEIDETQKIKEKINGLV